MARFALYGQQELVPLQAFAAGLDLLGHDYLWREHSFWTHAPRDFDAVVIYGLRGQGRDIAKHYADRNIPLIVLDHGYMRRVHVLADYETGYFQIGIGRLGWTPAVAPDAARFESLGVEIKQRDPRPMRRAMIAGQTPFDASHHRTEAQLRMAYTILDEQLRERGLRTTFRPHPKGQAVRPPIQPDGIRTLDAALADADLVATINSNSGLDALLAGLPVVTLQPCHYTELSYRWPVPLAVIQPPKPDRLRGFLERLAWAQWTADEMREGLPQTFLASIGAIP